HLHQFFDVANVPDDGSDKPGYPSNQWTWKLWWLDRAPRIEVNDEWYGFRYAGLRKTPNGHTHARITAYTVPYGTIIASIPFNRFELFVVPIDDHSCYRYHFSTGATPNPKGYGGPPMTNTPYERNFRPGVNPRNFVAANDYELSREDQKKVTFSGIRDFISQDMAVTESMGRIYDRSKEHLGTTDLAVIKMRQLLLSAAKGLAEGKEPPGLAGDFVRIRAAEKILDAEEDWRVLGTDDDPAVQEAYAVTQEA
ncbi:MAG: hypothetical protein J2P58_15970, partial [Acidimicrobiaceae bacterium]|nr:hypothetical protein [Acidimicrobiaceae bacterium]